MRSHFKGMTLSLTAFREKEWIRLADVSKISVSMNYEILLHRLKENGTLLSNTYVLIFLVTALVHSVDVIVFLIYSAFLALFYWGILLLIYRVEDEEEYVAKRNLLLLTQSAAAPNPQPPLPTKNKKKKKMKKEESDIEEDMV